MNGSPDVDPRGLREMLFVSGPTTLDVIGGSLFMEVRARCGGDDGKDPPE